MKKTDILLLAAILLACALALTTAYLVLGKSGDTVVVTVDGEEYARLPLKEDTELVITTERGTNTLIINNGEAYIGEASCPDKVCVKTGHADELKSIVCLPNRVVVSVERG